MSETMIRLPNACTRFDFRLFPHIWIAYSLEVTNSLSLAKPLEKLTASAIRKGHCQVQSAIKLTMMTIRE